MKATGVALPRAAFALALAAGTALAGAPLGADVPRSGNLIRNSSFEGSLKYWHHNLDSRLELVKGDASGGDHCLSYEKGKYPWSAPFVLEPGTTVTVSASLRAPAGKGKFHVFLVPTCRSAGKEPFKIFWGKSGVGTEVAWTEWRRVSWELTIPDAKTLDYRTWWDGRSWMLVPTGEGVRLDEIAVRVGAGEKDWAPWSPVEVTEVATNLPPWKPSARILEKGFEVELETAVHNPAREARMTTVRWQLVDFAGRRVLADLGRRDVALRAGATELLRHSTKLQTNGLVLARATVLDARGEALGRSDQPLTTLPFPGGATRPNWKERFGGGVSAGNPHPTHLLEACRKIGIAWSRWYPHLNWERCQPKGPDSWDWPDDIVKSTLDAGISINAVLFAKPKWAFDEAKSRHLPVDMADWSGDDPRWDDLSIVTRWDRYVTEVVRRYRDKSIAWEVVNEPLWDKWDGKIYFRFIERTHRLIKKVKPDAVVMTDGCYGVDWLHRSFLEQGGAKFMDVYTFHNYSGGEFYSGDGIAGIRQALDAAGGKRIEIWFNEGWTHFPSSEDYPCQTLWADRTPERVVNGAVRTTAETFAAGMEKLIMFQLGYDHQGRSWWDWDGDGTSLYDDRHQPMAVVPAFNVLIEHLGLSRHVASVRADGATFHVFQDDRNARGVAVAWAERDGVSFDLPLSGLVVMDTMGNATDVRGQRGRSSFSLAEPWTPVYVYSSRKADGETLARALRPFERPNVILSEGVYTIPDDWLKKGAEGNPYLLKEKPIWWLGRVYPPDCERVANWRRLEKWIPAETKWFEDADSQGGNPAAGLGGGLRITVVTEWKGGDRIKPSALVFVAPEAAEYVLEADVVSERWCGGGQCWAELYVLDRASGEARRIMRRDLPDRQAVRIEERATLAKGQELALVYGATGWHTGSGLRFERLVVARSDARRPPRIEGADPAHATR